MSLKVTTLKINFGWIWGGWMVETMVLIPGGGMWDWCGPQTSGSSQLRTVLCLVLPLHETCLVEQQKQRSVCLFFLLHCCWPSNIFYWSSMQGLLGHVFLKNNPTNNLEVGIATFSPSTYVYALSSWFLQYCLVLLFIRGDNTWICHYPVEQRTSLRPYWYGWVHVPNCYFLPDAIRDGGPPATSKCCKSGPKEPSCVPSWIGTCNRICTTPRGSYRVTSHWGINNIIVNLCANVLIRNWK